MKFIKKILAEIIIIILELLKHVVDLLIKTECRVAGAGFMLLAIFSVLAVINRQWSMLGLLGILIILCVSSMLLSVHILIGIETVIEWIDRKRSVTRRKEN